MKNTLQYKSWIAVLFAFILSSCSSSNYLTISVNEPAPAYVPSTIKAIGIIDRSVPTDKYNKIINEIDKVLSAEGKNLDKEGAQSAILGLHDELQSFNRFNIVKTIENSTIKNSGMAAMPAALPWETVKTLCKSNSVDAIFELSFYDTDANITINATPVTVQGPLNLKINTIETQATVNTLIKVGWRIYNPNNLVICDEFSSNERVTSSGKGLNPMRAVEAIIGRKDQVISASTALGHRYALRIQPYSIRVTREYYVRGTDNFKIGKRRALTGDWDGAAEMWKKEINNTDRKIAGRACYNMAINNEINGNLDAAIDWASKSYTDYFNKKALQYLSILKNRKAINHQLQQEQ